MGGGTAGLVAAIILKKRLDVIVDVIYSEEVGIVGVGEGTTEHWSEFMRYAGIHPHTLIKECDATPKLGIMFQGWGENDYLHSISNEYAAQLGQTARIFSRLIGGNALPCQLVPPAVWNGYMPVSALDATQPFFSNQFHFNTHKLNIFLRKKAVELGVNMIEDKVMTVQRDAIGNPVGLIGQKSSYTHDFYIDATGFRRLLIGNKAEWRSYRKWLKMNEAVVFATADEPRYDLWTKATAMNAGWMWKIPTWGRIGNGYVYDSDYITSDKAVEEASDYLDMNIDDARVIKFDSGALDEAWIGNVCAIGLSASFVEPLEASNIGTSIQQAFMLMHKLPNYTPLDVKSYNEHFRSITDNTRDFISLHYMSERSNSDFWKDNRSSQILPPDIREKISMWQRRLPIYSDFDMNTSNYALFGPNHFIMVMHGLGLFDNKSIMAEYEGLHDDHRAQAERLMADIQQRQANLQVIDNKQGLDIIRGTYVD